MAQRLESAVYGARADHLPDRHGSAEAFDGDRAESAGFKKFTEEATGAAGNNHRIRLGERLKPRGKIGGLSDHLMLLRHALTAEVPNDHQAGGNADPHV